MKTIKVIAIIFLTSTLTLAGCSLSPSKDSNISTFELFERISAIKRTSAFIDPSLSDSQKTRWIITCNDEAGLICTTNTRHYDDTKKSLKLYMGLPSYESKNNENEITTYKASDFGVFVQLEKLDKTCKLTIISPIKYDEFLNKLNNENKEH